MLRVGLFLTIYVLLAVYGGYSIIHAVRVFRKPRVYPNTLYSWVERPGMTFRYDRASWLAINIHRFTLVALGLIALIALLLRPPDVAGLAPFLGSMSFVVGPLLCGAMALLGFGLGYSLFGPLAETFGGDHHCAVFPEGLLMSSQLLPWNAFSHFDLDSTRNVIYVWSRSLPGAICAVLVPPSAEDALSLSGILQNYLPASGPYSSGLPPRLVFPGLMALLCAPFLVIALFLFGAPSALSLMVDAVLLWVLMLLGAQLILRLIYGNKARPAP